MRWWGWGEDEHATPLGEPALELLRAELEVEPDERQAPIALADVPLPESRLSGAVRERLAAAVGAENVREDRAARVGHAAGRSYPDLIRLRTGQGLEPPDAVVRPASAEAVAAVLSACAEAGVAVVPFGGGTSVVGGVEPLVGRFGAVISLDLRLLDRLVDVDAMSLTATLEAGLLGPEVERRLASAGLTLGHHPQSFEYSTVGGWVATRSAGQASSGYGRIDELVEGLRLVAPAGELRVSPLPARAAGPELRELAVGSEGVLGVICEATLRVRPRPRARRYEGWSFESFAAGCAALRTVEQADAAPDLARLSDESETGMSFALSADPGAAERVGRAYLRLRGHERGCLAIVGFEGEEDEVERRRRHTGGLLRGAGGLRLGRRPGEAWLRGRYAAPYLRDELLARGVLVDTLETATSWSNLAALYGTVRAALERALGERGTPPRVLCHVSHMYRSGASLYFTFLARQDREAPLEQWWAAKTAATEAIVAGGGTITHHHAVGRDHAPWLHAEVGELGIELIRAAKERLDPAGVMNPSKLLPTGSRRWTCSGPG